jgi:hypothetical protein
MGGPLHTIKPDDPGHRAGVILGSQRHVVQLKEGSVGPVDPSRQPSTG